VNGGWDLRAQVSSPAAAVVTHNQEAGGTLKKATANETVEGHNRVNGRAQRRICHGEGIYAWNRYATPQFASARILSTRCATLSMALDAEAPDRQRSNAAANQVQ